MAVYELHNDPIRTESSIADEMGEPIGYVATWAELDAIATDRGVLSHQIDGDGYAEMEKSWLRSLDDAWYEGRARRLGQDAESFGEVA